MAEKEHYAKCREIMQRLPGRHTKRLVATGILLLVNIFFYTLTFIVQYPSENFEIIMQGWAPWDLTAFGMGIVTVLYEIVFFVIAWFSEAKRPAMTVLVCCMSVLGFVLKLYHAITMTGLLVIWFTSIPDIRQYRWVSKQPGFPHFSERLDEQEKNAEYKPLHEIKAPSEWKPQEKPAAPALPPVDKAAVTGEMTDDTSPRPASPEVTSLQEEGVTVAPIANVASQPKKKAVTPSPDAAEGVLSAAVEESHPVSPVRYEPEDFAPTPEKEPPADTSHYEECRRKLSFHQLLIKGRFLITAFVLAVNVVMFFAHGYTSGTMSLDMGDAGVSVLFMLAAIVLSGYILFLAASVTEDPTNVRDILLVTGLLAGGCLLNIIQPMFLFLAVLWATQLLEVRTYRWLRAQEGYPYFNERFHETQKRGNHYVSQERRAKVPSPNIEDEAAAEQAAVDALRERRRREREREAAEDARASQEESRRVLTEGAEDEMPGVEMVSAEEMPSVAMPPEEETAPDTDPEAPVTMPDVFEAWEERVEKR